jgi:hypothetical protein
MADDWFDNLIDQDWAGETRTAPPPAGGDRLPAPGQVIDLGKPDTPAEAPSPEAVDTPDSSDGAPDAPGEPVGIDKAEPETGRDQQSAYDAIADAIRAAADRLPTAEDAAEARRDIVRSRRARAALYNATAAAAGLLPAAAGATWTLPGTVTGWLDNIAAEASIGGALVIGAGLAALVWAVWDRRTRTLPAWAAWTCRIPLASVVAGVLLWAPAWDSLNL